MKQVSSRMAPAGYILVILLLWELAVRLFHIPLYILPAPTAIAAALGEEWPVLYFPTLALSKSGYGSKLQFPLSLYTGSPVVLFLCRGIYLRQQHVIVVAVRVVDHGVQLL